MEEPLQHRFSLVVATLGRVEEIERLLVSLVAQQRRDLEVLFVDQNGDDRLVPLLARFSAEIDIVHIRSSEKGVCRARNRGAAQARGAWLMFPDDDCWYPDAFFQTLEALMASEPADIYSGRPTATDGRTIMGDFATEPTALTRDTVWDTLMEWIVIVRRPVYEVAGGFDAALGPGSGTIWGAHEVQDMILNCLETGATGQYFPALTAHHPEDHGDRRTHEHAQKMYRYGAGLGYVLRRHGFPMRRFLPEIIRPLVGIFVYGLKADWAMARRSRQLLLGRLQGWRTAPARHTARRSDLEPVLPKA
ncbi:glycosyltransferase family A protein [Rhizobium sp. NFR03]|uniref:glycosyltransferase family 2 protein n=1 Tax=Rhizobium sp. NFR03 TaxID=1566263 RepID=UPI0008CB45D1|nr:glycosyltransferase family A protein [Rhizobium sp. NFR03]SES31514.1 Glycosyl transferase family 2 [Rhizobium sp. NFR03]